MAITVGLDFGTHQTKICIEDTADKQNPNYSFWKFKDSNGHNQYVCPSVIQLNEDNTLSYGYVSDTNCKMGFHIDIEKPQEPQIQEPILELPPKPTALLLPDIDCKYDKVVDKEYESLQKRIKITNQLLEADYRAICSLLQKSYNRKQQLYLSTLGMYKAKLKRWETYYSAPMKMRYYYFKQATFSSFDWKYKDTSPILLSIWYIANIIFDLEEKFGQNFSIQMGVPTGAKDFKHRKQLAVSVLLSAYKLVEEMFNNDKKAFLSSTIEELETLTDIVPYSEEKKEEFGILVFPEAYAGLRMLAARGKIARGMNLNVDIGGGTTDISFFVIDKGKPHIYRYESIPKGLNWIIQDAFGDEAILKRRAFLDFNSSSEYNRKAILQSTNKFYQDILKTHAGIIKMLWGEWVEKMGTLHKYRLTAALQNRPIIYMGGGSTYPQLRKVVGDFSEVHIVNGDFWAGVQIEYIEDMYPVLNTALGLSVGETDDNIEIHSINELWKDNEENNDTAFNQSDYNLLDIE